MLDRARDTDGDIQRWRDDLARLAHLPVVRHEAGIDGGARSTHGGAQLVGQRFQDVEVLGRTHATAAGHDDFRGGQFRTVGLGQFAAHEGRFAGVGNGGDGFGGSRTAGGGSGVETGGAHGDDLDLVARLHGGNRVTGVDRTLERIWRVDLGDFRDLRHVQLGSHARQDVLAVGGGWRQDVAVVAGDGQHLLGHVFGQAVGEVWRVGHDDFRHAGDLRGGSGGSRGVRTCDEYVHVAAALGSRGHGVVGAAL